jgi:hypothetical protein
MMGAHRGDSGSDHSFTRCRWSVTQAKTHAAHRGEDGELITWLGRRLRWTVVALDGEPSGGWRRAEKSKRECECGEGKVKIGTVPFGLAQG